MGRSSRRRRGELFRNTPCILRWTGDGGDDAWPRAYAAAEPLTRWATASTYRTFKLPALY